MRPRNIWSSWDCIVKELKNARRVAVFTDFDGTLTRIRRKPRDARLPVAARKALRTLREKGALCGIVSGRSLRDIRTRAGVAGIWYVGSHGASFRAPDNHELHLVNHKQRRLMRQAKTFLHRALRRVKGVRLEEKSGVVAIHYRGAGASARQSARQALDQLVQRVPGLQSMHGKKVWEVLPRGRMDKAAAIEHILRRQGRSRWREQFCVVYLGDDVTDESVFKRFRGVTVAVGERSGTAACYFVRTPGEARKFLVRLAELLP